MKHYSIDSSASQKGCHIWFSNRHHKTPLTPPVPGAALPSKRSHSAVQTVHLPFRTLSPSTRFVNVDKYMYIINIKDTKMRHMPQQNVLSCSKLTMLSENHLQNLIFLNIFSHCRIVYKIDISFQYLFNKYQLGAADQKFCVTEVFFWTGFNAEHTHVPLSVFEQNYTGIGNSYLLTASLRKQILFTLIIL